MENREFIQELPIEPRLKQLATPLSIILPLFGENEKIKNKFVEWLLRRQRQIIEDRKNSPEGWVFNAIISLASGETEELPEKYKDYIYNPQIDGEDYSYTQEDEGKPIVITTGMLKDFTGVSANKLKKILKELGFKVEKKKIKIKDKRKTPHVILLENPIRWAEDWRRYVDIREVGEIPEILKDERIDYNLVPTVPEVPAYRGTGVSYQKNRIKTLKDKLFYFSGVRNTVGTVGTTGTTSPFLADLSEVTPFKIVDSQLEINNIRGYEISRDVPSVIITEGTDAGILTYNSALRVILLGPPSGVKVKMLRDVPHRIALPDGDTIPLWKGREYYLNKRIAEILQMLNRGKIIDAPANFINIFKNIRLSEDMPEVLRDLKEGETIAIWEN